MNEQNKPLEVPEIFLTIVDECKGHLRASQQVHVFQELPAKDAATGYWYGLRPKTISVVDCLNVYGVVPSSSASVLRLVASGWEVQALA
ncbi:MAG: hypothetical protein L3J47_00225 [Sulfurovum sp.]|nr:hypothetical protein [Sulfurovum sp.]